MKTNMLKKNTTVNLIKNKKFNVETKNLPILNPKKIRVKIKAVGVCASDIPRAYESGAYNYPLIMGHEISGQIFESNFKNFKKNDKVSIFPLLPCKKCSYCKKKNFNHCISYSYYGSREDGGYAEYIDVYPWNIIKIPKNVNYIDSFALEPSAVAHNTVSTLFKKKPKNNEKILLLGCGFIGLLIAEILKIKYKNLNLTVIDRNEHKLKNVPKIYTTINLKNKKKLNFLKNSFNYIIETTGNDDLISKIFSFANHKASIILMGNINKEVKFKKIEINYILRKELKLLGIWNSNYKNPVQDDWKEIIKLLKKGLRPSKFISHKILLNQIPNYIKRIYLSRKKLAKFKFLKIVALND